MDDMLVNEHAKHMSGPALDFVSSQLKTLHRNVTKALLDTFKIKVNVMADHLKLCCVFIDKYWQ